MNAAVTGIWSATLTAGYLVVVPSAVGFLHRTLLAAQEIERYSQEIRDNAGRIADHTANIPALQDTIAVAVGLTGALDGLDRDLAAIEGALGAPVAAAQGEGQGAE